MPSEVAHVFICLLEIWASSFLKCLFMSLEFEEQGLCFILESHLRQPYKVLGSIEADFLEPLANTDGSSLRH